MTVPSLSDVAVIVLSLNQRDLTLAFLRSLFRASRDEPRVLLWDNGSSDGTGEAVAKEYPSVHYHRHDANLGVASGRNAAATLAMELWDPAYLLFLDNDMELAEDFIGSLLTVISGSAVVGQVQAKLRFWDRRERLNWGGGCRINFLTGETVPVGYDEVDRGQYDQVKPCVPGGGAMMVRSEIFRDLRGFDAAFDPFGPEDLDFSLRLQKAGYRSLFVPQALAYHMESHTYGAGYPEYYARHKARHWLTFLGRHGTLLQKVGFFTVGAPYVVARLIVREGRRGNLGAVRGMLRGVMDTLLRR